MEQSEPESEFVRGLLAKSGENAEVNARQVREKTLANGMGGAIGPFSNSRAILASDGNLELISLQRFEKLRDQGRIVENVNGLYVYKE